MCKEKDEKLEMLRQLAEADGRHREIRQEYVGRIGQAAAGYRL